MAVGCFVAAIGCQTKSDGLPRASARSDAGASGGRATGGRPGSGGRPGTGGATGEGGAGVDTAPEAPIDLGAPEVKRETPAPPDLPTALPEVAKPVIWKPTVGLTWDWQLAVPITPTTNVDVFDIDLWANSREVIADLHARGKKVVCHVDLGTLELTRPDADRFPRTATGNPYNGNPERLWLDIRAYLQIVPAIRGRLDLAVQKGCDAIAPDNLDAWDLKAHGDPGFPLTGLDQLVYNRIIATEAHARGLAVGLRNDLRQIEDLVGDFDFHVSNDCYQRKDCALLLPFISAGKPVFDAEYTLTTGQFCAMAKTQKISAMKKRPALDSFREACPP